MSKYSDSEINFKDENNSLFKIISLVPEGSKVLDFGCASGYLGEYLVSKKKCTVIGLEYDQNDAKEAESRGYEKVFVCDLDYDKWGSNFESEKYDVAIFADVLEHLKYPDTALKNTKKLLKEDGRILVSIPNVAHLSIRLELLNGSFEYEDLGILDDTHLKYWTRDSFLRMANNVDLYAEKIDWVDIPMSAEDLKKRIGDIQIKDLGLFDSDEARAFQYIFSLVKSKENNKTVEVQKKPLDGMVRFERLEMERDTAIKHGENLEKILSGSNKAQDYLEGELANYKKHAENLEDKAKHLEGELANYKKHAENLEHHLKIYKVDCEVYKEKAQKSKQVLEEKNAILNNLRNEVKNLNERIKFIEEQKIIKILEKVKVLKLKDSYVKG